VTALEVGQETLVEEAKALVPLIIEHRQQGEADARMPRPVLEAAGAAGLFRLFAPREVGGHEASLPVAARVFEVIATADPTVAWYMVNSVAASHAVAYLSPGHRDELFAEPDRHFGVCVAPGGRAAPRGNGFRLEGEWPLVTGVLDTRWCVLSGLVMDGDQPARVRGLVDLRRFLVPTELLEVETIWEDATVMRATGSHRVRLASTEIPGWSALDMTTPPETDRPLYLLGSLMSTMTGNAAVPVGILSSALDAAANELGHKVSATTNRAATSSSATLEMIAEADAALRSIRAGLRSAAAELWDAAESGSRGSNEQRSALFGYQHYAAKVAREVISELYGRTSRAAFFRGHPLELGLRNIHAVNYAFETIRLVQHSAAMVRMGHQPTIPGE